MVDTSSTNQSSGDAGELGMAVIAAIAIGGMALVLAVALFCRRRCSRSQSQVPRQASPACNNVVHNMASSSESASPQEIEVTIKMSD